MFSGALKGIKIIIGGGSIAGCSAAILLKRLGAEVIVLERSLRPHEGRGAGIVLPDAFIKTCIDLNLLDVDIPRLRVLRRSFFVKDKSNSRIGKKIWEQFPFSVSALNWGDIYQNLLKRVPTDAYHTGEAVSRIHLVANTCKVETSQGNHYQADLLIAADGIDSLIRKQIYPQVSAQYVNYIAWRGITDNPAFVDQAMFDENIPYYVFPKGHLLLYCIPSANYQHSGKKLLNWVMYENRRESSLENLLINNKGVHHSVSLPPGSLTLQHIEHLHQFSEESLPNEISSIICQTDKPFLQAVFDLQVTNYVKDKICFIGDAASVLRPHSASGTIKALQDSIQLARNFEKYQTNNLVAALDEWNQTQLATAQEQVLLSKTMGEALVTNPPNWENMNENLMDEWWKKVMSGKKWYATDHKQE